MPGRRRAGEHLAGAATNLEQVVVAVHIQAQFPDGSTGELAGCGGTFKPGYLFGAQAQGLTDDQNASGSNQAWTMNWGSTMAERL